MKCRKILNLWHPSFSGAQNLKAAASAAFLLLVLPGFNCACAALIGVP